VAAGRQQTLHRTVLGLDPGDNAPYTAKARRGDGCRHQQRSHPMMLDAVINGHRQLVGSRAHGLENEMTDDPPTGYCYKTIAPPMISRCEFHGLPVSDAARRSVESRRAATFRKVGVETSELDRIAICDPAHANVVLHHVLIVRLGRRRIEC
jgi:hypothetical protein